MKLDTCLIGNVWSNLQFEPKGVVDETFLTFFPPNLGSQVKCLHGTVVIHITIQPRRIDAGDADLAMPYELKRWNGEVSRFFTGQDSFPKSRTTRCHEMLAD